MTDPRLEFIGRRLEKIDKIIAVSSGKGGVGKSMMASALALGLKEKGHRVGLLDLDFTSPSTHVILGVEGIRFTDAAAQEKIRAYVNELSPGEELTVTVLRGGKRIELKAVLIDP